MGSFPAREKPTASAEVFAALRCCIAGSWTYSAGEIWRYRIPADAKSHLVKGLRLHFLSTEEAVDRLAFHGKAGKDAYSLIQVKSIEDN